MSVKLCRSVLTVVLVDVNPRVVRAWQAAFHDAPEVEIVGGSILDQHVDAWVTPTNARGSMDGGVDAAIKHRLGPEIERRVQEAIRRLHGGAMPIGAATCVPTGAVAPRYLISTPTMTRSAESIRGTLNVALACAAAFQAIHLQNAQQPDSIRSVAVPGLGAATGRVPARRCASLMWTAYQLFLDAEFPDFGTMRAALLDQLSGIDALPVSTRVRIQPPSRRVLPEEPSAEVSPSWSVTGEAEWQGLRRGISEDHFLR
jgi:O-acetyl-ADP-ribose deacetylase (regulator of RNase III)